MAPAFLMQPEGGRRDYVLNLRNRVNESPYLALRLGRGFDILYFSSVDIIDAPD